MKYIELKDKSLEELNELLKKEKMELFTSKMKLKTMQLTNTAELRNIRKNIARIKTAISSKKA